MESPPTEIESEQLPLQKQQGKVESPLKEIESEQLSLQKQREELISPPVLPSTVDLKQQSRHPIVTLPQKSNKPLAEQSNSSTAVPRVHCEPRMPKESGMQSELQEVAEKSKTKIQDHSQIVENFHITSQFGMRPEMMSLSARLWARNLGASGSLKVENNCPTFSGQKITVIQDASEVSSQIEQKNAVAKSLIRVWRAESQRNSKDKIRHDTTIISSPTIQERTIWTANKWYLFVLYLK